MAEKSLIGALFGESGQAGGGAFGGGISALLKPLLGGSLFASAPTGAGPGGIPLMSAADPGPSIFSGFGFADGGVMTSLGPLPLRRYATGGVANSPQLSMFGEGRSPEAYVPLPDGRSIPVNMKGGSSSGAPQVNMTVHNYSGEPVTQRVTPQGVQLIVGQALKEYDGKLQSSMADKQARGWNG